MKFLSALLVSLFLITAPAHAGKIKEIYTSAQEEVEFYYQATGEWQLVKIRKMDFVNVESAEFTMLSAKTLIRNIATREMVSETCLVTYVTDDLSFHSINCF